MANLLSAALRTVALVLPAHAQGATWIVDANNGPGTHFTSLSAAVFTSAPGDLLLVRSGNYQPVFLDRPLFIVADSGAIVTGSGGYGPGFMVGAMPAGSTTAIVGLTLAATSLTHESLRVMAGPGTVILDRIHSTEYSTLLYSDDVRCSRCEFDRGLTTNVSTAALERCRIGPHPWDIDPASLRATGCYLRLERCVVRGRDPQPYFGTTLPATPAIELSATTLVLGDDGSGAIAAGAVGPAAAIVGSGVVEVDPHVTLLPSGGAMSTQGVSVTARVRPSLAVDAGPPGGAVALDLFGPNGDGYLEAVGIAVPPTVSPAVADRLWLQPMLLWSIGTFGPSGRATAQVPLPNLPIIVGVSFTWQAAAFGAVSGLAVSNPVSYVHPAN
ncbi:MAG: hypothetical protein KDE27_25320 [Planctomycetes bacterium]|nr:hypothetical protein [Planctomycetota bacterium]